MRAAVGVALFVLGIAAGVTVDRLWLVPPRGNPMDSASLLSEMDRRLDLDSTQHAAIARVLDHRQAAIDSAWRAVHPAVRGAVDSAQMEIVSTLRPDQRERYLRWVQTAHGSGMHATEPNR